MLANPTLAAVVPDLIVDVASWLALFAFVAMLDAVLLPILRSPFIDTVVPDTVNGITGDKLPLLSNVFILKLVDVNIISLTAPVASLLANNSIPAKTPPAVTFTPYLEDSLPFISAVADAVVLTDA